MSQVINHSALKAAQSKAVIARYLGDEVMFKQANIQMREAFGLPLYRRGNEKTIWCCDKRCVSCSCKW
ncbi:host cell division inhibitory peptide Kil [Enterobacter chuandaensis]|uniref:host cell division inhibitory peptide Kil n=1 Tax=Enterobacter chuandaensis TaxID=2497875 RepID=UPI003FD642B9